MSTSTGTLQPKVHIGAPLVWAVVALFAAATIAVYALTTTESREEPASSQTTVSGTAANTPTELRGGFIETAAAPAVRPFGRAGVIPRVGEITSIVNTPSELGTVISFSSATPAVTVRAKQLGLDLTAAAPSTAARVTEARNAMLGSYQEGSGDEILVNGEPCAVCWKYR